MRITWSVLAAMGLAAVCAAADDKGTVVNFDGIQSTTPAEWKEEKPSSQMRFKQFRLTKVKDDKDDAELVIFKGIGGSAKDNIKRWKDQFVAPEGKNLDDLAKVTEMKVSGASVTLLDVQGTFLFKARPQDTKTENRPDYRMLAAHFQGKSDVYHIKLVGPAKTIEHYKKGFEDWLKAFK